MAFMWESGSSIKIISCKLALRRNMTDIEFSTLLHNDISVNYKIALDFLTVNPDYSLVSFRKILEILCPEIAEKKQVRLKGKNLNNHISDLYEKKIINEEFKNNLLDAKRHTNAGAHKHPAFHDNSSYAEIKQIFIDKAIVVRALMIKILEDAYLVINNGCELPEIEEISINDQRYKEILFDAAMSLDDKIKLHAGVIYESMGDDFALEHSSTMVHSYYPYHLESLYKLAADHYEASYKISADIDENRRKTAKSEEWVDTDEFILRHCKLEPLFKYAILAAEGFIGVQQKDHGLKLMLIAADREYSAAQAYWGAYLYGEKEYSLAKTYLEIAAEKDEFMAYRFLFYFYGEGNACKKDEKLALNYLYRGIKSGCNDCLAELGIAYHKGILIEQNDDKAKEILQKASDAGSLMAHQYFTIEFNDLRGKYIKKVEEFLQHMNNLASISTNGQKKIGANENCPCGSGKKYKKCCRNQSTKSTPKNLLLP